MRSELRKVIVGRFKSYFASKLPSFAVTKAAESASGSVIYEGKAGDGLCFYISIQFHQQRDSFTLEIAWSEKARWPSRVLPASPVEKPQWGIKKGMPINGEFRARLTRFWWDGKEDMWWDVGEKSSLADFDRLMDDMATGKPAWKREPEIDIEKAKTRALDLANDAFLKVIEYAIPFFKTVANEHNVTWPMLEMTEAS